MIRSVERNVAVAGRTGEPHASRGRVQPDLHEQVLDQLQRREQLTRLRVVERVRASLGSVSAQAVRGIGLRRVAPSRHVARRELLRDVQDVAAEVRGVVEERTADRRPAAHARRDDEDLPLCCRGDVRQVHAVMLVPKRRAPRRCVAATVARVGLRSGTGALETSELFRLRFVLPGFAVDCPAPARWPASCKRRARPSNSRYLRSWSTLGFAVDAALADAAPRALGSADAVDVALATAELLCGEAPIRATGSPARASVFLHAAGVNVNVSVNVNTASPATGRCSRFRHIPSTACMGNEPVSSSPELTFS